MADHVKRIKDAQAELQAAESAHRLAESEHRESRAKRNNTHHALRQARAKLEAAIRDAAEEETGPQGENFL